MAKMPAPARDHRLSVGRSVPTTGQRRAAAAWLWGLLRGGGIEFYNYDKATGRFAIATTAAENAGQGTDTWAAPTYDTDGALELCFTIDDDLEHVPAAFLDAMAKRFRPAAPKPATRRRKVTPLVELLDAIRAAHHADEAILSDDLLERITAELDQ